MYLWTAIDASDALGEIRRRAEAENRDLALNEAAFTLPMHVSLKISFALAEEQAEAAVAEIAAFLGEQPPFPVQVEGLEQQGSLLWIRMQPSDRLRALHDGLDARLEARFGVPQHAFDKSFLFHATQFLEEDVQRVARMLERLRNAPLPAAFSAERYLIGCSESGQPGTYRVIRRAEGLTNRPRDIV